MEPSPEVMALMSRMLPPMTRLISMFIPGRDSSIAWRNAKNNAEIIQLVAHVSAVLPPPGTQVPLPQLVEKCYSLGTFPSLWAVEGLGHWYADSVYGRKEQPQGLLTGENANGLPEKSLTMLHAGIGMSFAKRNLDGLKANTPAATIRKAVEEVVRLCKDSSQPGYAGAAIESLGLACRFLHPDLIHAVERQLSEIQQDLVGYLWHGAGRAMYFSPPNFIPGWSTPWRALATTRTEPQDDLGRRNAMAGFAWAITLVNMKYPIIMETLLKYHGKELLENDAFANGVASSLVMRYDISPDDPTIQAFHEYRPADSKVTELWDRLVKTPCDLALSRYHGALKKHRHLEEVFRYQDLGGLVNKLEKG